LRNGRQEEGDKNINSSMAALSVGRENLREQAYRPSLSQEYPQHFGLQNAENHQLSNGQALLSQEVRGVIVCKDPERRPLRSQPCHFCASSSAKGAAATPMATSPPDRAPDSPKRAAQPASGDSVSAAEQQDTSKAARNMTVEAAMRDGELALW